MKSISLKMSNDSKTVPQEKEMSKKRPAPSAARLAKLKRLKENENGPYVSRTLAAAPTSAPSASKDSTVQETGATNEFVRSIAIPLHEMETEVSLWRKRNGQFIPKLHMKGDARKKKITFGLPPMVVKWQSLGKEGNFNKKMGNNVITDINKARFTVSLTKGCPKALEAVFPTLVNQQNEFYNALVSKCREHMEIAYIQEDDSSWHTDGKEMSEFVEGANFSCLKSHTEEDGEKVTLVNLTRRVVDFQGDSNQCVFWKSNENGEFIQIEPKYIRKGSLLQCIGSLRSYNVNEDMYGVSMDLERDIVVVWMPPVEKEKSKQGPVQPVIPFIKFDY